MVTPAQFLTHPWEVEQSAPLNANALYSVSTPDTCLAWSVGANRTILKTNLCGCADPQQVPDAPVLTQQGAGVYSRSLITQPNLNLYWLPSSGAVTYRMQVSTSPLFTSTVFDLAGIPQNSPLVFQPVPISVLPVGVYYRRVDAKNSGGTSAWSAVSSFTMAP